MRSSELACPRCGSPMIRRIRRADNSPFWGCSRYPACWGTRALEAIEAVRPVEPPAPLPDAVPWDDPSWKRGATAGASARRTGERRAARHRARVREATPRILITGLVLALAGTALVFLGDPSWRLFGWSLIGIAALGTLTRLLVLPAHVRAWTVGAEGEERVAALLSGLRPEGFIVLNDLRIPGTRENIDHVVVGPAGVFVVETKHYSGLVRARGGELVVSGRRKTEFIDQVERQVAALRRTLGVDITAYIAFVGADFPWFGRQRVRGVEALPLARLAKEIAAQPERLDESEVRRLAGLIEATFPPAARG